MKLYLVQHGESVPEEIDPKRPLTENGRADVSKAARFLKDAEVQINIIWHSTKLRAEQTAELISEVIKPSRGVEERIGLAPNDPVDKIKDELLKEENDLMIVGHLPFLWKLISLILLGNGSYNIISFRQGGVVCLEKKPEGNWFLIWAIVPELIKV